jgi:predicted transcriptional regulator
MEESMRIKEVLPLIDGKILTANQNLNIKINSVFSSDLMSDVLAFVKEDSALLTGLVNNQVIRTAEMLDLKTIIFVRGKSPDERIIELADENNMVLITSDYTLYETSGILYQNGLKPVSI